DAEEIPGGAGRWVACLSELPRGTSHAIRVLSRVGDKLPLRTGKVRLEKREPARRERAHGLVIERGRTRAEMAFARRPNRAAPRARGEERREEGMNAVERGLIGERGRRGIGERDDLPLRKKMPLRAHVDSLPRRPESER